MFMRVVPVSVAHTHACVWCVCYRDLRKMVGALHYHCPLRQALSWSLERGWLPAHPSKPLVSALDSTKVTDVWPCVAAFCVGA